MLEAPPTLHGPTERILAAIARARRHSEQKRGHVNALRQLVEECRRHSPSLADRMSKELVGIQLTGCSMLSDINGIETEFSVPFGRPSVPATALELHPAHHGRELPLFDGKMAAANDHSLEREGEG